MFIMWYLNVNKRRQLREEQCQ